MIDEVKPFLKFREVVEGDGTFNLASCYGPYFKCLFLFQTNESRIIPWRKTPRQGVRGLHQGLPWSPEMGEPRQVPEQNPRRELGVLDQTKLRQY